MFKARVNAAPSGYKPKTIDLPWILDYENYMGEGGCPCVYAACACDGLQGWEMGGCVERKGDGEEWEERTSRQRRGEGHMHAAEQPPFWRPFHIPHTPLHLRSTCLLALADRHVLPPWAALQTWS